jgi:hypothetical protein
MAPRTLGRYEIVSLVGEGGMGRVYKALDPAIGRTVAIKTLNVDLDPAQLEEFKQRFFREARTAGRVQHPNVVTIYDVGEQDGLRVHHDGVRRGPDAARDHGRGLAAKVDTPAASRARSRAARRCAPAERRPPRRRPRTSWWGRVAR